MKNPKSESGAAARAPARLYGIWCKYANDWFHEEGGNGPALLAFANKREACRRAARAYGFATYTEVKQAGWCEVLLLTK